MRIVQVGQYPLSADCIRGGVEASVYGLARELSTQGYEVHAFDLPRIDGANSIEPIAGEDGEGRVSVHRYANPGSHNVDQMKRADDMLHDILALYPDVVHVHGTGDVPAYLYKAIRVANIPLMLTIHGLLRVEKQHKLHQAWQNLHTGTDPLCKKRIPALVKALYQYIRQSRVECNLLEVADRAIVDTGYLLDALKEYPVKHLPELHVIPQGANERYYEQEKRETRSEKRELRVGTKTILCVGTFSRRKSQVLLIRAFELLRKKQEERHEEPTQLVLCGVMAEGDYYNEVGDAIDQSIYCEDIRLYVDKSQEFLLEKYHEATIFALHSQEESQGIVLAEAMAMGLAVVSTRVGGIPYVVEDGISGILTEYGDVEATAEALDRLLSDNDLREKMSVVAKTIAEKYRWRNIAEEITNLYRLCSQNAKSSSVTIPG